MRRLAPTVHALDLPREPFLRLIQANRRDQEQATYETFDDLLAYCELSANPVGELVLHVFDAATPERIALSDRVCTGLQLVEHWQDVAEDFRRGRVYLPAEDLARFEVARDDLGVGARRPAAAASCSISRWAEPRICSTRARRSSGTLRGRGRFAVAGYVGGGRANADAIVAAGYDVLAGPPKASGRKRLRATLRCLEDGPMTATPRDCAAGLRALPPRRAGVRLELLRRHAPAAARPARRALRDLRARPADRRHRRRRPSRGREARPARAHARRAGADRGESDDPVLVAVADAARRYPIPLGAFGELVDGAEMDVRGADYATFAELELYCRCVAGSIGRLALGVFECSDRAGGRAASPTTSASRCSSATSCATSPRTSRTAASTCRARTSSGSGARPSTAGSTGPVELVIAFEAQRALERLDRGLALVPLLDRRSAACVLAMTGAYRRLLERIAADPAVVSRGRLSLSPLGEGRRARAQPRRRDDVSRRRTRRDRGRRAWRASPQRSNAPTPARR